MITTNNLSKRYGDKLAVDDLTFSVAPGEVLGFLGANGAGKSTTMRMIAGFIAPSAGRVSVCGHDIEDAPVAAKSCMGYLPEGAPSYGEMTVAEFLDFVADVRGLAGERRRQGWERRNGRPRRPLGCRACTSHRGCGSLGTMGTQVVRVT